MIETAFVFDIEGKIIYWHEPHGRSGGSLPDSRSLWLVLWENKVRLGGVAHSHPWDGPADASHTDITTFSAVERGLGKNLIWPVVTMTEISYWLLNENVGEYQCLHPDWVNFDKESWMKNIKELRQKSQGGNHG